MVCVCKGKRHSQKCGSFTDAYIQAARRNLYCAISQCGNSLAVRVCVSVKKSCRSAKKSYCSVEERSSGRIRFVLANAIVPAVFFHVLAAKSCQNTGVVSMLFARVCFWAPSLLTVR